MRILQYFLLFASLAFISCANDLEEVEKLAVSESFPDISGDSVHLFYSDSGRITVTMAAQKVISYATIDEPYTEFPEGIHVVYFTNFPDTASMIRSDYAIKYEKEHKWEAKGNVVAKNIEGETLETEFLVWDELKGKIYTNEQVTISTQSDVIWGNGFEADQDFSNWTIKKISGELSLENEFEENDTAQ